MDISEVLALMQGARSRADYMAPDILQFIFANELAGISPLIPRDQLYRLIAIGAIVFKSAASEAEADRETLRLLDAVRKP